MNRKLIFTLFLVFAVLLVGCLITQVGNRTFPAVTTEPTAIPPTAVPTETQVPTATPTAKPTDVPTPTEESTEVPTPTTTPTVEVSGVCSEKDLYDFFWYTTETADTYQIVGKNLYREPSFSSPVVGRMHNLATILGSPYVGGEGTYCEDGYMWVLINDGATGVIGWIPSAR